MAVLTRSLEGAWQITYDVEARQLFVVGNLGNRLSVNEFLALNEGTAAETTLEGLIIDMFLNTPEDDDRAEGPN
jgi:hypothetical protein